MTYPALFRSFFRNLNSSAKLLVLISILACAVVAAFAVLDFTRTKISMHDELKAFANRFPATMALSLEPVLANQQFAQAEKILHANMQDRRVLCMVLRPAATAHKDKAFGLKKQGGNLIQTSSCDEGRGVLSQTIPLMNRDSSTGQLTVTYRTDHITQALRAMILNTLVKAFILVTVLCLGLFAALRCLVFAPLNRITETVQLIIDTKRSTDKTPLDHEGELERLTKRFNMMIYEMDKRDRQLRDHSEDLQKKISARYCELTEKNTALLAANKRLLELDELKSRFLSTVSHDLRTPLTSILGFSKLINQDFCKLFLPFAGQDKKLLKRGERIKHNLLIIQHEGERLTRLINDFLDLSRIESGRMQWRDTGVSVRRLAKRAAEAVQGQLALKPDLELRIEVQKDLPMLHCDEDRMMQVFVNLLNNAAKFTLSGQVMLRASLRQEKLRIEVQDTGPGIPKDQLAKIFDKFHKVDETDHTHEKKPAGSGLGLAICRETVQHYKGRIWAESEPGKGSTFIIELPSFRHTQSGAYPVEEKQDTIKTRILVVDDNAFIREYFTQLLSTAPYEVFQAKSGEEALEKAQEILPDLIIMDLLMPGMGGETAIRHFRSNPKLSSIPILIISISQDTLEYSADARLEKPVDPEHFLEVVNNLLRRGRTHIPVLVVGKPDCLPPNLLPDSDAVEFISADTVTDRIKSGYRGTIVLSRAMLNELSLNLLEQPPEINFLIVGCA